MSDAERDFLVEYLAARDVACPGCSYSLRGLKGAVCPECGIDLEVRVGKVEKPASPGWIGGLICTSMMSGPVFLSLIWFGLVLLFQGPSWIGMAYGWEWALIAGCGVVDGAILICWLRGRRSISMAPRGRQWRLAIGAGVLAAIYPVWGLLRVILM